MTDPSDSLTTSQLMAERYGRGSSRQKWRLVGLLGLVVVAMLVWLAWAAWVHATTSVSGDVVSFDVVSQHEIDVTVEISRPAGSAVTCTVQAQAVDHSVVGEIVVSVTPAQSADHQITSRIKTDREATSASVSDCH